MERTETPTGHEVSVAPIVTLAVIEPMTPVRVVVVPTQTPSSTVWPGTWWWRFQASPVNQALTAIVIVTPTR